MVNLLLLVPHVDCRQPPALQSRQTRYPSYLTDAEWAHIEPLIPPGKPGGGKRRVAIREVINGVMYILSTGCQLARRCPRICRLRSTVHDGGGQWNWAARWIAVLSMRRTSSPNEKAAREASRGLHHRQRCEKKLKKGGSPILAATASTPAKIINQKRHVYDKQGLLMHGVPPPTIATAVSRCW